MIPDHVKSMMLKLEENDYECYIVGGFALHRFAWFQLGLENYNHPPKDIDIFTNAPPEVIQKLFDCVAISGQSEKIYTFTMKNDNKIEISTYRSDGQRLQNNGKTIYDHQSTCDFTINSVALKADGSFVLPPNVIHHLKNQHLVAMGNPLDRIYEDNNRIMRAFRVAAKYNLAIENKLYEVLRNTPITNIPKEVIHDEFLKLLPMENGLDNLYHSGKLFEILPKLQEMQNIIGSGKHHEESCLEHSIVVYENMLKHTKDPILLFSGLVHDIGKVTAYDEETKKFINHESVGATEAKALMQDLKFKNTDIKRVEWLVKNHMKCRNDHDCTKRSRLKWYKFYNKMDNAGASIYDHILLKYIDSISRKAEGSWIYSRMNCESFETFKNSDITYKCYKDYINDKFPQTLKQLNITGNNLMELGIPAGPFIGETLEKLYIMVLAGEIPNDNKILTNQVIKWMSDQQEVN